MGNAVAHRRQRVAIHTLRESFFILDIAARNIAGIFDMPTERDKMLAGELYDPLDPELVAARDRARDLCQTLNATREARRRTSAGASCASCSAPAATRSGCSRRSSATTARTSSWASGSSSTSTASCSTSARSGSATSPCSARRCRSTPPLHPLNAELRRRAGIRQADRDRLRRLGRRRGDHLSRRPTIGSRVGHRRRQRGHARHPGRRFRRRQSLPRDPEITE